jgi:protein-S-isoprenylcysteine O-methyltransferase Ste14
MLISFLHWLTFLASLFFFLVYFKGGTSILKDAKRSIDTPGGRSYLIAVILMYPPALTILLTQLLICLGIVDVLSSAEHWSMVMLGMTLVITGIFAMFWVRYHYLGRFWSGSVELKEQHEVIESGPYRAVRHPLYALALMVYLGLTLAFAVWWNLIACGMMIAGYLWLTAYEDGFLEANLPGYREYQQRTRYRLVPGIW